MLADRALAMRTAVERLSERERHVLALVHVHELQGAEIGRMLGVSESRVSQILAGIRRKLKDQLAAYDADPLPGVAGQPGVSPRRIAASRVASMLPPETMQTMRSPGTRPETAAATASAPAPSATTRARSASRRTAAAVSSSDTANDPASRPPGTLPHRRQERPAAGAVDE